MGEIREVTAGREQGVWGHGDALKPLQDLWLYSA